MPRSPRLLFPSGVPGLDDVLGGGIPEASLSLIGGGAGTGKTTLALQFAFANATAKAPALYFCGPAEPADRLAEYHEQLKFFDARRLDREVHLIDLGAHFSERDSGRVLDALAHDIAAYDPGVIVVDLPRSLTPPAMWSEILLFLAARLATTVVVTDGEPRDQEMCLADTVVSLEHAERGHTCVEVVKARGQSQLPGKHAMRLDWEGVRVFPRWATPWRGHIHRIGGDRLPTGVEGLDRLLSGGVRQPGSVLVDGASGTGKTMLATQFIAECGHQGRPGLVVLTEERPERFIARAHAMDLELERLVSCGLVELLSLRGRDVSGDELLHLIQRATLEIGAQAVVLDSVCGLDLLLDDVRDWLWRAVDSLSGAGVSVWLNGSAAPQLSSLVDDVLSLMRVDGVRRLELVKSSTFLTLRGSGPAVFEYEIGAHGIVGLSREEPRPTNGHLVSYRFAG
jgi:circadian clock protein KaiC